MIDRVLAGVAFLLLTIIWPIAMPVYWIITGKEYLDLFEKLTDKFEQAQGGVGRG